MFRYFQTNLRKIEDLMRNHCSNGFPSQVGTAGASINGMVDDMIWLGHRLKSVAFVTWLATTFLA
jgi:hypothetical protein